MHLASPDRLRLWRPCQAYITLGNAPLMGRRSRITEVAIVWPAGLSRPQYQTLHHWVMPRHAQREVTLMCCPRKSSSQCQQLPNSQLTSCCNKFPQWNKAILSSRFGNIDFGNYFFTVVLLDSWNGMDMQEDIWVQEYFTNSPFALIIFNVLMSSIAKLKELK